MHPAKSVKLANEADRKLAWTSQREALHQEMSAALSTDAFKDLASTLQG